MMGVPAAHKITKGSKAVTVAIMDTGAVPATASRRRIQLQKPDYWGSVTVAFDGVCLSDSFEWSQKSFSPMVFPAGLDATHPDLIGQVDKSKSVSCVGGVANSSPAAWNDVDGHGTCVPRSSSRAAVKAVPMRYQGSGLSLVPTAFRSACGAQLFS